MRLPSAIPTISIAAALLFAGAASAQNVGNVVEGRKAWLRLNCYGCHGDNGQGARAPSIITPARRAINIQIAMEGAHVGSGMPSYVGVPLVRPTDFADMAAYMRTIRTNQEPKWHDWWLR